MLSLLELQLTSFTSRELSVPPSFHPQDQRRGKKKEKKKHLVLIRRELYSPASVSTPFTGALPFYSGRFVLTQTAGSLASFFFFAPP